MQPFYAQLLWRQFTLPVKYYTDEKLWVYEEYGSHEELRC